MNQVSVNHSGRLYVCAVLFPLLATCSATRKWGSLRKDASSSQC